MPASQGFDLYPPQPHHTRAPSRNLQFEYTNWKGTGIRVTDLSQGNLLYTADVKILKPHLIVKTVSPAETVMGTVAFHILRSQIDLQVYGSTIALHRKGALHIYFTYISPTYHDKRLNWRSKSSFQCFDFSCETEDGESLARFSTRSWNIKKIGQLEVFGQMGQDGDFMDEMVVAVLALVQYSGAMRAAV